MKIHIISIGGAVMHNLAMALKKNGHEVTGSDDEIYDPSRSRLEKAGLLPQEMGWFPEHIHKDIDGCILGMHARPGNPEIERAQELGIPIYSFPEFVSRASKNKKRVVVAGSHGKTTTTSMIMHALKFNQVNFDYLVGAQLDGFDHMVQLSDAPIMIIEGDEYLSSALDRRPKFLHYNPHLSVITGVAWDHMNVFPTFDLYLKAFTDFIKSHAENSEVFYYEKDKHLREITKGDFQHTALTPYNHLAYDIHSNGNLVVHIEGERYETSIVGTHNAQNLNAAYLVCRKLGLSANEFGTSLKHFTGADKRLQLVCDNENNRAYLDFAHAPSKVKTTLNSMVEQFPDEKWIAVSELHTYSSLNKAFLPNYKHALKAASVPIVFYSPHAMKMKKMEPISKATIKSAFDDSRLLVATDKQELDEYLRRYHGQGYSLLLMSSGTFGGVNIRFHAEEIIKKH